MEVRSHLVGPVPDSERALQHNVSSFEFSLIDLTLESAAAYRLSGAAALVTNLVNRVLQSHSGAVRHWLVRMSPCPDIGRRLQAPEQGAPSLCTERITKTLSERDSEHVYLLRGSPTRVHAFDRSSTDTSWLLSCTPHARVVCASRETLTWHGRAPHSQNNPCPGATLSALLAAAVCGGNTQLRSSTPDARYAVTSPPPSMCVAAAAAYVCADSSQAS